MAKTAKKRVKTLSIRIPQEVAVALQKRAKAENRSVNAQIVADAIACNFEYSTRQPTGV